jgi:hypothetical protein
METINPINTKSINPVAVSSRYFPIIQTKILKIVVLSWFLLSFLFPNNPEKSPKSWFFPNSQIPHSLPAHTIARDNHSDEED